MKTVQSVDELVQRGYKNLRLVDAQDYEVLKYRRKYPTLNIWSADGDDLTRAVLFLGERDGVATVLPAKIHKYPTLVDQSTVFVCLDFIGGLS